MTIDEQGLLIEEVRAGGLTIDEKGLLIEEVWTGGLTIDEQGLLIEEVRAGGLTIDEQGFPIDEGKKSIRIPRSAIFHFSNRHSLFINRQSLPFFPSFAFFPSAIGTPCSSIVNHFSSLSFLLPFINHLSLFCCAVLTLFTKMLINSSFSWMSGLRRSGGQRGFRMMTLSQICVSRSSFRATFIL